MQVNLSFPVPPDFVYDKDKPTYYTELYSWACHKHQAALSAAGASVHVETATPEAQLSSVAAYGELLSGWSSSVVGVLSDYLTGEDDAPLPAIPDLPALPELLLSAASLLPGGRLALLFKTAVPLIKGFLELREKLRPTDPVRLLDKALLKNSWWLPGARSSYLGLINDKLQVIADKLGESSDIDLDKYFKTSRSLESLGIPVGVSVADLLVTLLRLLSTVDCGGDIAGLTDVLFRSLSECVPAGGDAFDLSTIKQSVDTLSHVLGVMSIEIETEKAAKVTLAGVECQETVPYPNNI